MTIKKYSQQPSRIAHINSTMVSIVGLFIMLCSVFSSAIANTQNSPYALVGEPLATIYSANEHGGHNQNWTSIQSDDGFIYVGHTLGISQWDGENWFNLNTPESTPVRSISQFQGALYYGTTDALFKLIVDDTGQLVTNLLTPEPAPNIDDFGDVWSTATNAYGVIFVTEENTFFHDGERTYLLPDVLSSKHGIFAINNKFYFKVRDLPYLYTISVANNQGELSFTQTQLPLTLPKTARVMEILTGADNNLTIVTEQHGVYQRIDGVLQQVIAPQAFAEDIRLYDAILSKDGFYYISSTHNGLFILDSSLNILRQYFDADGISMNTVFSVNEDLQGNIWLTGIPNVVKMRPPHIISQFKAGNASTEILRLKNTSLGIFAAGNGIFKLTIGDEPRQTPSFKSLSSNINNSVDLIEYGPHLIRSGYEGIFELELNQTLTNVTEERQLINTIQGRALQLNPNTQDLLVSSSDGAYILTKNDNDFSYQLFPEQLDKLISLYLDKHDTLWLGSATSQLYKLESVSSLGVEAPIIEFQQKDGLGLGPVEIFNIDSEAIFSSAGKLLRFDNEQIQAANLPMLSSDWLEGSLLIDQLVQTHESANTPERIWYRKNGSSGYFEKQDDEQWREYTDIFDNVPSGGFNDLFVTTDNILWFVRDKAEIYRVDIALARELPPMAPLNIRRMESNDQPISFNVAQGNYIELLPTQTNIRFNYASADSSVASPIEYRTRLDDGDDARWSNWSQETYRDFTQLRPAHYRLQVQAKDAWNRTTETYLDLVIVAPWYLSSVAYALYALLTFMLVIGFTWLVQRWRTAALKAANKALELKVEARTKEVSEKVEQLRQQQVLKDRFFGNVSHEFRTPLTLTIGPLETLITEHKNELSKPVTHLAKTALNNASKMLALVGQVLDLNRLEAGKLPLRIAQYDIADLLRNISERFQTWAKQHQQRIETIDCDEPLLLWFDIDQFDKCVSNLLSNAIKYSGKGTTIQIQLCSSPEHAEIMVRDNGVGISKGAKQKVFDRFYQDTASESLSTPGTGIGLALVKELMELHHGDAHLAENQDQGCCFVLMLKTGHQHFEADQIIEPIEVATLQNENDFSELQNFEQAPSNNAITPAQEDITTLLIVDDNQELLNFISLRLSASFKILQAVNGQDGFEKACEHLPDLIISDVNMPIMTGLELASKIKANAETKTIPIILLTAKATKREVVAGFSTGADDYLTKPFDTSELIMRVNAQINSRKLIRNSQKKNDNTGQTSNAPLSFKDKLYYVVDQQLGEPMFNVEQLSSALHMTRDTLIRKCKKECGDTPLNIIVQKRMLRADKLLQENTMSISEVAYACGFESLAYFSKSYKKQRGISPSEVATS